MTPTTRDDARAADADADDATTRAADDDATTTRAADDDENDESTRESTMRVREKIALYDGADDAAKSRANANAGRGIYARTR